jgi:ribosomal protein S18 acetylase RimI-like enzyme
MNTPLIVRFARINDARAVQNVLSAVRNEIPIGGNVASEDFLKEIRSDCKARRYVVVNGNDGLSGVMRLVGIEIYYLAVAPANRRNGVARALINYAKKRNGALFGKTRDDNFSTIALLKGEGFRRDTILIAKQGWSAYSWARTKGMREKYQLG